MASSINFSELEPVMLSDNTEVKIPMVASCENGPTSEKTDCDEGKSLGYAISQECDGECEDQCSLSCSIPSQRNHKLTFNTEPLLISPEKICENDIPINIDGNIQCAQKEFVASNVDDALYNLPKDDYLMKILEVFDSDEEHLSRYRAKLADKARMCDHPPCGQLKERRKSSKASVAKKYALDCYDLNQFLWGNTCDVGHIFKQSQPINEKVDREDTDKTELATIKSVVAELKAEFHIIKAENAEMKQSLKNIKKCITEEMKSMKNELDLCASIISKDVHKPTQKDPPTLSNGFKEITERLKRLEKSRNQILLDISEIDERVSDNSRNVSEALDNDTQNKNALKMTSKEMNEKFADFAQTANEEKKEIEHTRKSMDNKVKQLEAKVNNNNHLPTMERALNSFASEISSKLDTLNANISYITQNRHELNSSVKSSHERNSRANVELSDIDELETATHHNDNDTHTDNDKEQQTGKQIPVILKSRPVVHAPVNRAQHQNEQSNTQFQQPDNRNTDTHTQCNHKFKGVLRQKAKPYLVTGISPDSSESGLEEFLTGLGIVFKTAKFVVTRRSDCLSAYIVVNEDQANIVEDLNSWPPGVYCRPWLPRAEYKQRFNRKQTQDE